jgi:hypothetical protein
VIPFDLFCWHCGGRNFCLVADEQGGTKITCEHHEDHVAEVAAELAEQDGDDRG